MNNQEEFIYNNAFKMFVNKGNNQADAEKCGAHAVDLYRKGKAKNGRGLTCIEEAVKHWSKQVRIKK